MCGSRMTGNTAFREKAELQIRKMTSNDFVFLHRLLSDPEVMKHLEPPFSEAKTKGFLEEAGLCEPAQVYAVDLQSHFIGYVIYHPYDEAAMEIGWVLFPEYWGKGYASKITKILIEKAKNEQKSVVIECVPQQAASKRIAENHGFAYCGNADGLDVYKLNFEG